MNDQQRTAVVPYLTLLLWLLPLLVFHNGQSSLMAHDEGYYAQQARWIWETGDWITPQWWGQPLYDRTVGIQWLIAVSYTLFGVSEFTARLPSFLACGLSVLLTYAIGRRLLGNLVGWIGAAILCVMPLWVEYGRLATQDMTLVCLELLGIWAFLQVEQAKQGRWFWSGLAGMTLGLGFLVKGFMVVLPVVALLPYLLFSRVGRRSLTNPGLYGGIILGALPVAIWLVLSWQQYGWLPVAQLFGKLFVLGSRAWHRGAGPLYYFWNIPLNTFPWALFTLIGWGLLLQPGTTQLLAAVHRSDRTSTFTDTLGPRLLLLGYPLLLFIELTLFKTRTPYYALQLYPFMALVAALALIWLVQLYRQQTAGWRSSSTRQTTWRLLPALFSYAFGGLGLLLVIAGVVINLGINPLPQLPFGEVQRYGVLALGLGLGWLSLLSLWWLGNHTMGRLSRYWLGSWLLGPWLALMIAGLTGIIGDYSPGVKAILQQPQVAAVLRAHPINFVVQDQLAGEDQKIWVLLSFYTPQLGKKLDQRSAIPASGYAWVSPELTTQSHSSARVIATVQGWQLIQST